MRMCLFPCNCYMEMNVCKDLLKLIMSIQTGKCQLFSIACVYLTDNQSSSFLLSYESISLAY